MAYRFEAVTVIIVVGRRAPALDVLETLEARLSELAADQEIVIIANGVEADIAQQLRHIAENIANVTVQFVAQRVDTDSAVLLGMDQALGDWIIVLTPTAEEIAALPGLLEKAGPYEVIFAGARDKKDVPSGYRSLAGLYFKLYTLVSGAQLDWPPPRIRIYSRAAARYLVSLLDGEFALRSLNFSGAFPGTRETVSTLPSRDLELPGLARALRKGLRGLLNASAVPLRAVIVVAVFTGLISLLSSAYALVVFFLNRDVEPGWTTLSLQISMMMFLFSLMFALIAEYVLKVYTALAPRRRAVVVREIRSPLRRQRDRLNVIGSDGSFRLGAPAQPLPSSPEVSA